MLAIRIHEIGGVDKLRAEEIPLPQPRALPAATIHHLQVDRLYY